eukprot:TRINITY_DN9850_c0_g1_i3.p1 TRINITY_DN9850_c0_g1~~TRINITY_DN9850_c0_g1_i3.p1  ORF type:complete len:206 (-),score=51.52 TRINITY_DN9850_c0_g1_i3:81-638(-)
MCIRDSTSIMYKETLYEIRGKRHFDEYTEGPMQHSRYFSYELQDEQSVAHKLKRLRIDPHESSLLDDCEANDQMQEMQDNQIEVEGKAMDAAEIYKESNETLKNAVLTSRSRHQILQRKTLSVASINKEGIETDDETARQINNYYKESKRTLFQAYVQRVIAHNKRIEEMERVSNNTMLAENLDQ